APPPRGGRAVGGAVGLGVAVYAGSRALAICAGVALAAAALLSALLLARATSLSFTFGAWVRSGTTGWVVKPFAGRRSAPCETPEAQGTVPRSCRRRPRRASRPTPPSAEPAPSSPAASGRPRYPPPRPRPPLHRRARRGAATPTGTAGRRGCASRPERGGGRSPTGAPARR